MSNKSESKNIYQRINAVMKKITYVQKDTKVDGKYLVVTHDNVTAQLRQHLVDEGIVVQVEQIDGGLLVQRDLEKNIKMHLYSGTYNISFVNIDDPADRLTTVVEAHAADNGDKSCGKAISYATKYAMLKTFSIETGENEESRTYEEPSYTDHQKEIFDKIVDDKNALEFVIFSQTVGGDVITALNFSFPDGKKSIGKATVKKLEVDGWNQIKDTAQTISGMIELNDPAVIEITDEMGDTEKKLVAGQLTGEEINYLKSLKEIN